MKVIESQARSLLEEMHKAKPDSPTKRILFRLNNIQTTIQGAQDPTSQENINLLKKIFEAVESGDTIELEGLEDKIKPTPSAKGSPTKEPAVEKRHKHKHKQEQEETQNSTWTPGDVAKEIKELKKKHKGDVVKMIEGAKEFLKETKYATQKELAQLVLNQLRKMDGAPQEIVEEEVVEKKAKQKGGFGGRGGNKDPWGNLTTSRGHMVNKVITKAPKTIDIISEECGLPKGFCLTHLRWMAKTRGFVIESEEGWRAK